MCTKIIDGKWTPMINMLIMTCGDCLSIFDHRADRWTVRCPDCGKQAGLGKLRKEYVAEKLMGGE